MILSEPHSLLGRVRYDSRTDDAARGEPGGVLRRRAPGRVRADAGRAPGASVTPL